MTYLEGAIYLVIIQLLVVAFLNLKSKIQSNKLLGIILLLFADALRKTFIPIYIDETFFNILVFNFHVDMLYGPFIYFYLRSKKERIETKAILYHSLFPIIYITSLTVGMLTYRLVVGATESLYFNMYVTETRALVFFFYLFLSLRFILSNQWTLVRNEMRYRFFLFILGATLSVYYFNLFLMKYAYHFVYDNRVAFITVSYSVFLMSILFLVYYGITELNRLKSFFLNSHVQNIDHLSQVFQKIDSSIERLFKESKIHRKSDLNLSMLADLLEVKKSDLSDFIKQKEQSTFYDFINKWRVDEFKQNLIDSKYDHLDILGIAYESGFQSKATFNRAFKKMENQTPSEYKKTLLVEV